MFSEIKDLYRASITRESINIGDVFKYMGTNQNDPFKRNEEFLVTIIDIQDRYVRYAFGETQNESVTNSCSIFIFRSMYKKKT